MQHDELLHYYEQELAFIHRMCAEFAASHPKIAGRLRLGPNGADDPQVTRLLQAFSFCNAHIRAKLEDEFPEISSALLQILHPNALSPIPSMAILQFQVNDAKLMAKKTIQADTTLFSEPIRNQPCTFKTCYAVELLPLSVEQAALMAKPAIVPVVPSLPNCPGVLRLSLTCEQPQLMFNTLGIDRLRFFINAPAPYAQAMYGLLFQHTEAIAIASSPRDARPLVLPKQALQPVGFAENEGMLPYNKRTFLGYRFLSEFFALPEKFLFFELTSLEKAIASKFTAADTHLEIYFYFSQSNPALEKIIDSTCFALHCTPIVNLFAKQSEPLTVNAVEKEFCLRADAEMPVDAVEIYSVNRVTATNQANETQEYLPFNGLTHYKNGVYYQMTQKPAWEGGHYPVPGTEMFLSFTDLQGNSMAQEGQCVRAELYCTNRDMPALLPYGEGQPKFEFEKKQELVSEIRCLTPITPSRRPFQQQGHSWRYVSHLALNHLAFPKDANGIDELRGLLALYDFDNSDAHKQLLGAFMSIESKTAFTRRPPGQRGGNPFWHGTEITLCIDDAKLNGRDLYLFGYVLNQFFALYTTTQLYTQLIIKNKQHVIYCFPPQMGSKPVL